MNNIPNPRTAALIGLILALPIPLFLLIVLFEIEPMHAFLRDWVTGSDGVRQSASSLIFLIGCLLLLPVAIVVTLTPVAQNLRAGKGFSAPTMNLALALAILLLFAGITGVIIVDQYPCWMGVPNCD